MLRSTLLLVVAAVHLGGCYDPSAADIACGDYPQTTLLIGTADSGGNPITAHIVTCEAVSDDVMAATCTNEGCSIWRCMGVEGGVLVEAIAGSLEGSDIAYVSPDVCGADPATVTINLE